ncbi:rna-directed dna polymerase from mobile element jockey- hypothetical protein [Limosa lapponica baueri]|uniref:Uncharacterized protein n=1 Tax=Limosa lapponica baueri TaxID=1758121 RepID=A0A2I0USB5_LIMLA|nr:rna-directed dna polymerase from mobile element jockey- hypothetical protein [Limosa lapponica baueri]
MEQLILGAISEHMEEKKAIRSSQHGFTKGKSCQTNLRAFYDGMTGWMDKKKAVDVVYLDFSKAFDTLSHSILIATFLFLPIISVAFLTVKHTDLKFLAQISII